MGIVLIIVIIAISNLYLLSSVTIQKMENQTMIVNGTKITQSIQVPAFNSTAWEKSDSVSLSSGILAASATILTISFVITQWMMQDIAKNYNAVVLESYINKKVTQYSFYGFVLVVIISSVLLLLSSTLDSLIQFILSLVMIDGFAASVILFVLHYYNVFRMINPVYTIDLIGKTTHDLYIEE